MAKIQQISMDSNHSNLAINYINIGELHREMRDYKNALSFYRKALTIQKTSLSSNNRDLSITYHSIGEVYSCMEKHSDALKFYRKNL